MSELKATPGPWHLELAGDFGTLAICAEGERVTSPPYGKALAIVEKSEPHGKPNAHLISAAPELYEALEEIINTPSIGGKGGLARARKALAKARGES